VLPVSLQVLDAGEGGGGMSILSAVSLLFSIGEHDLEELLLIF
jgi:hypothetical protein